MFAQSWFLFLVLLVNSDIFDADLVGKNKPVAMEEFDSEKRNKSIWVASNGFFALFTFRDLTHLSCSTNVKFLFEIIQKMITSVGMEEHVFEYRGKK